VLAGVVVGDLVGGVEELRVGVAVGVRDVVEEAVKEVDIRENVLAADRASRCHTVVTPASRRASEEPPSVRGVAHIGRPVRVASLGT